MNACLYTGMLSYFIKQFAKTKLASSVPAIHGANINHYYGFNNACIDYTHPQPE